MLLLNFYKTAIFYLTLVILQQAKKSITNNLNTKNFKHYENKFQKNWIIGISNFIIN